MKKRILIVFPGLNLKVDEGAKHRMNSFIDAYDKAGYDVEVLGFIKTNWLTIGKKRFVNQKAKWIFRICPLPISKHILLTKLLEWWFNFNVALQTHTKRYDIVQMELFSCWSILCNKKSKYITDFHGDSLHEYCEMKGVPQKHWFAEWSLRMQKHGVVTSDLCIFVSENLKKQIEKNTNTRVRNYAVVSCGVDINRFASVQAPKTIAEELKKRIVIGYSGGLQKWQDIEKIIDLAIRLSTADNRIFLMIYTNHDISPYQSKLDMLGVGNYGVLALKSEEIPAYLKLLDAGLLIRDNRVLNTVSSPTKICEYLAAGLPVICTKYSGDYARSVTHGETGYVLEDSVVATVDIPTLLHYLRDVKENKSIFSKKCIEKAALRTFEAEFICLINNLERKIPVNY